MNEEEIKKLKFGESCRTSDGNKYTRTINGWIYSNFSGTSICFIPDVTGNGADTGFEKTVIKKEITSKKTK